MKTKEDYYNFIYTKLISTFPQKPWTTALNNIKKANKPTVKQLVDYFIPYGIELWENKGNAEYDDYLNSTISDSFYYCGKILELFELIKPNHQERFKSRFNAAFRQPHDMRALIFETFVFFTLAYYGYNIECKDDDSTGETYDYLIKKDTSKVQIECKSFAYDKGLYITGDEAQKIIDYILEMRDDFNINENPTGEISLLTVEITSSPKNLGELTKSISSKIREKNYTSTEDFILHLERHTNVKDISDTDAALDFLHLNQHGVNLGLCVSPPNNDQSRYGLIITTHATNGFLREFEKVCKDAAKKQLKKNHPASIIVHIYNIELLKDLLDDSRFHQKINNIFMQDHIISLIIISNIQTHTQIEYPFFYISPFIKEFVNNNSKFIQQASKIL